MIKDYYRDLLESLTLEANEIWDHCDSLKLELRITPAKEEKIKIAKLIKVEAQKYWDFRWKIQKVRIKLKKYLKSLD